MDRYLTNTDLLSTVFYGIHMRAISQVPRNLIYTMCLEITHLNLLSHLSGDNKLRDILPLGELTDVVRQSYITSQKAPILPHQELFPICSIYVSHCLTTHSRIPFLLAYIVIKTYATQCATINLQTEIMSQLHCWAYTS